MERTDKGWYFDYSVTNENTLKPLCVEVEKHFTLPARRLLRYFAASDDFQLRQEPPVGFGTYYRGFHVPLSGRHSLPMHLQSVFFHPLEQFTEVVSFDVMVAFDNLIYIRDSTCSDVTGCVTNYAHELQHFVQQSSTDGRSRGGQPEGQMGVLSGCPIFHQLQSARSNCSICRKVQGKN